MRRSRVPAPTTLSRPFRALLPTIAALVLLFNGYGRAAAAASGPPGQPIQDTATPAPPSSPDHAAVPLAYLVTVGPGDAVWERFGHSLIWIHDPAAGTDEAYNYGLFSFQQEHFLLRFVMGHMLYWMAGFDVRRQLAAYRSQHRSIEIQELALPPDRVRELQSFLQWNERPENRFYRYEYFRDNCSTRVRDALNRVVGGQLGRWARARRTDASYRDHVLRLSHGLFWVSVGMDFGLGPSVDEPVTAWQAMFVPMEMEKELRSFKVRTESGDSVPFVRSERTYYDAGRPPVPDTTPRWIVSFLLTGILLAGLFWWLGRRALRGHAESRIGLLSLAVPWLLVIGLVGTLIAFLWAFTDHVDTRWNTNLLQASPVQLAFAFVLWPLARGKPWARRGGRWTAAAVAALALIGVAVKILPVVGQTNAEFLGLLVPPNLALAWVAWRMAKTPAPEEGATRPS